MDDSLCHHRIPSNPSRDLSNSMLVDATSIEQHKTLQHEVELRRSLIESVVENLVESNSCLKKIAEHLIETKCRLSDIVCLENVELTRVFLIEQYSMNNEEFDKNDATMSVDLVMSFLDVEHVGVVLKYGPNQSIKIRHFFNNLVTMTMQQRNLKALKLFVKSIIRWNILDEETSMLIEQQVFFKADKEIIQIFLQFELDRHIDRLFGINSMAALFGNSQIKINYMKRKERFNVNVRGTGNSTALHYAVKSKSFKKIKYLLDRGVEANSATSKHVTALNLALCEPNTNPIENEKCAELLLQYGADPFLLTLKWIINECCMMARSFSPPWFMHVSLGHLSKLVLAYICIYEAAGTKVFDLRETRGNHLHHISRVPKDDDCLQDFRKKCQQELQILKKHEIRENLTMFTILYETGRKLIPLLNEQDCERIRGFIDEYSEKMTLNAYYLNALREHMRQVRKLMAHKVE